MKKRIVITGIVILAIALGGVFAVRFGVGYVFDRYILDTALSSVTKNVVEPDQPESEQNEPEKVEETGAEADGPDETPDRPRLSKTEIISRVLKSQDLTYKMASMVPYEDKNRVVKIILSNFTAEELAEIAKTVSKGMPAGYKSKMITEARSRLTAAQWQECINIANEYIEKMRPYVE